MFFVCLCVSSCPYIYKLVNLLLLRKRSFLPSSENSGECPPDMRSKGRLSHYTCERFSTVKAVMTEGQGVQLWIQNSKSAIWV